MLRQHDQEYLYLVVSIDYRYIILYTMKQTLSADLISVSVGRKDQDRIILLSIKNFLNS